MIRKLVREGTTKSLSLLLQVSMMIFAFRIYASSGLDGNIGSMKQVVIGLVVLYQAATLHAYGWIYKQKIAGCDPSIMCRSMRMSPQWHLCAQ